MKPTKYRYRHEVEAVQYTGANALEIYHRYHTLPMRQEGGYFFKPEKNGKLCWARSGYYEVNEIGKGCYICEERGVVFLRTKAEVERDYAPVAAEPVAPGGNNGWRAIDSEQRKGDLRFLLIPFRKTFVTVGRWDADVNCYRYYGDDGPDDIQPTHWQPLPLPPAPNANGEG